MSLQKKTTNELSELSRKRIMKIVKSDPRFSGVIRGMLYNNLQEWKRVMFQLNYSPKFTGEAPDLLHVQGELWDAMRLTDGDKRFLAEEMLTIDEVELPDQFLVKVADKVIADIRSVSEAKMTQPQKTLLANLEDAMKEALTGSPF